LTVICFGFGVGKYKHSSFTSLDNISPFEYEHTRAVISKTSAENMALKEKLKTREELIRASHNESRVLREQSREDSCSLRAIYVVFFTKSFTSNSTIKLIRLMLHVRICLRVHLLDIFFFNKKDANTILVSSTILLTLY
jgi:hypothetical protein